jgi:hypothetical protein
LYVVEDISFPPPYELKQRSLNEQLFMEQYYNQTGLLWRHYYGPKGPRPPPKLYMWPATKVGEVHKVESIEGYWFIFYLFFSFKDFKKYIYSI